MVAHGSQKLFGWFGGYGIAGTAGFFEQLGFRPGRFFVITAALSEAASGILIALGLLGPIGPALLLSVMIVAAISVHWKNGALCHGQRHRGAAAVRDRRRRARVHRFRPVRPRRGAGNRPRLDARA